MAVLLALCLPVPGGAGGFPDQGGEGQLLANEPVIFSVMGDVPYGSSEIAVFQQHIDEHDVFSPSVFLAHVGDIKSGSEACSEDRYQIVAGILKSSQVPAYIVPGDNETTDCLDQAQGWQYWVQHLLRLEQGWGCAPATERQSSRPENFAFVHKGMLFLGINLVGGSNSTSIMQDDANWVSQQLQAKVSQVRGAVIFAQAGPGSNHSTFFNPFVTAAQSFAKPILYIHGDGHSWLLDHPFTATNVTRVQVEQGGSELPVQVTATLDSQNLFQFKRNPWTTASPPVTRPPCGAAQPMLAIGDASVLEGSTGTTATFTVTLSNPNGQTDTVQYGSTNGTALAGSDYTTTSGTLSFSGSTITRNISVTVSGDLEIESDEIFYVDLSNPTNAGLFDGRGQGTIRNDDGSNKAPVARSDDYATNEDVVLNVPAPGVLQNDSDPDGDLLTASLQSGTSFGTLVLAANGSFVYTPGADFSGSDEFTYVANDGRGGTATAAVPLSVTPVNDAPRASADTWITPVSTTLVVPAPGVLGNDVDPDGDAMNVQLAAAPAFGSVVLAADGSFTYMPNPGLDGVDSFTYRANDATSSGAVTTVTIGIGGPPSAALVPLADAYVTAAKSSNNYGNATELRVRGGTKLERSYLRFEVTGFPVVRAAKLRFYATDGSPDGGAVIPVANEYVGTTTPWIETGLKWINAPSLTASPVAALGNVVAGRWVEVDLSAAVGGNGTYCFALSGASANLARYHSKEAANKPQLVIERGNSNGVPGNQPPVAGADSYTASEDAALSVSAPGLLANDSDPDADALSVIGVGNPAHGTVSVQATGAFTYTPAANYQGGDGFTYTLSDGRGGTSTGSVTLAVTAANDAPVGLADTYVTGPDVPLTVASPGLLGNDTDVDGDALSAVLVDSTASGTLSLGSSGAFTYTPNSGFTGTDSFTYKANDGTSQSAVVTVDITVAAAPTGTVTFVEAQSGGSAGIATVATAAPIGGVPGQLYLAAIASKSLRSVTSVTGLGLTWTRVRAQCSGRSQTGVEIWKGVGSPSSGLVTATLASAPSNAAIAVARYAGADAANPLGAIVSGNSLGVDGACTGGVDNAALSLSLTTQGGLVFAGVAMRDHVLALGSDWIQRADARQGSGGTMASVTVFERAALVGTTPFAGTFDSMVDWTAAAVEIRPGSGTTKLVAPDEPQAGFAGVALERVFPNPVRRVASIAYELRGNAAVELVVYNARGQRVRRISAGTQSPGRHLLQWDTRDQAGLTVPAGIYFVQVQLGERTLKQKIVVQR